MIEIRTCESQIPEVAGFTTGVWRQTFGGKRLTINWHEAYFDWQLFNEFIERDYLLAAYDGAKLVGTLFAEPFRLRLHDREHDASMSSWLTVAPEYRRHDVGTKLVAEMRRRHLDRQAAFQIGFGLIGTIGPEFWRSMPDVFSVRALGFWCLLFDVRALRDSLFMSLFARSAMSLLRVWEQHPHHTVHEGVRPYRSADLSRCLELANELGRGMDLAYVWNERRLALQLDYKNLPRTLVYERYGRVEGVINYYPIECLGETTIKACMIDLCAFGSMSGREQKKLLRAAIAQMATEGIAMALLLRIPCYPTAALLSSGFIPLPNEFSVLCGWPQPGLHFEKVKSVYLHVR
jgi:GNAT superfamily N-acetyltransferase